MVGPPALVGADQGACAFLIRQTCKLVYDSRNIGMEGNRKSFSICICNFCKNLQKIEMI
ncbi:hypothetical protein G3A_01235 [Bacillus sp. 17376]|nr:hypothetical protein G3A_01235 [Bacillus sp. 17376]